MSLLTRFKLIEFKQDKMILKKKSVNDKYYIVIKGVVEVVDYQEIKKEKTEGRKGKEETENKKESQWNKEQKEEE